MVTRRAFLAAGGALTTAGLFNLGSAAPAVAGSARRLLPSFERPRHLDWGDIGDLSGAEQTLLTTLQGVVNRSRPELYYLFRGEDVDARWLRSIPVPQTRYDDPLALVGKYRRRVRGAVLYDTGVPDSINVATTLAGLEDSVAATPELAEKYQLRTVADLRGKFGDDRVATYRWEFENLFPRCTKRLLAGLPPTMVVETENVQWREVARETRQIRDSSNRAVVTLDVSAELGGTVYVKFADSFASDGWGASVGAVTIKANGTQLASFIPGTAAEEPYLFDGTNSSIGGDQNRFADGGGYFIYQVTPPAGTTSLTFEVDIWNQYLVSATKTAPTRIEPFPYFRDYVVATKAMVTWLPPNGPTGELLEQTFAAVPPATPYAGWFANDVAGEWSGVDLAAQAGVEVLPADFYMNGTVHSGVPAQIDSKPRTPIRTTPRNKIFLTLTFGEGDNVQYCQRHLRTIWDDPKRGQAPANWTISPLLADVGPALFGYYQRTATKNDLLISGPSGAGYTYPGSWPADEVKAYFELSGRYLRATGLDLVYAYNFREDDHWVELPESICKLYARYTPVRGIIQSWESGDLLVKRGGIPLIGNFSPPGNATEYLAALQQHTQAWNGSEPAFVAGAVNAWNWTPSDVAELAGILTDQFELVRGDTFFDLLRRTL